MDKMFVTYRSMIPEEHYHIPFLRSVKLSNAIKRKIRSIDYETFEQQDTFPLACKELQGMDVVCELYPISWEVLKYIHTPKGDPPSMEVVKEIDSPLDALSLDALSLDNMDIGSLINMVQKVSKEFDMNQFQAIASQVKTALEGEDMSNPLEIIKKVLADPDKLSELSNIVDPLVSKIQKKN